MLFLQIHGWALLKTDFTIPGGELGQSECTDKCDIAMA